MSPCLEGIFHSRDDSILLKEAGSKVPNQTHRMAERGGSDHAAAVKTRMKPRAGDADRATGQAAHGMGARRCCSSFPGQEAGATSVQHQAD